MTEGHRGRIDTGRGAAGRLVRGVGAGGFRCPHVPDADGAVLAGAGEGAAVGAEGHAEDPVRVAFQGVAEVAAVHIPESDGVVVAGAGEGAAVGSEGHAVDLFRVAPQGVAEIAAVHIPELHGAVPAAAGQGLSVGAEGHGADIVCVAFQGVAEVAAGGIPEAHGAVVAGGGQGLSVGAEGHAPDPARVALQGVQEGAGVGMPEAHGAVPAGGGQGLSVGTEGDAEDGPRGMLERALEGAGVGIPEADGEVVAATGESASVGTEGDAPDPFRVALQGVQEVSGVGIPEADGVVVAGTGEGVSVGSEGDAADRILVTLQGVAEAGGRDRVRGGCRRGAGRGRTPSLVHQVRQFEAREEQGARFHCEEGEVVVIGQIPEGQTDFDVDERVIFVAEGEPEQGDGVPAVVGGKRDVRRRRKVQDEVFGDEAAKREQGDLLQQHEHQVHPELELLRLGQRVEVIYCAVEGGPELLGLPDMDGFGHGQAEAAAGRQVLAGEGLQAQDEVVASGLAGIGFEPGLQDHAREIGGGEEVGVLLGHGQAVGAGGSAAAAQADVVGAGGGGDPVVAKLAGAGPVTGCGDAGAVGPMQEDFGVQGGVELDLDDVAPVSGGVKGEIVDVVVGVQHSGIGGLQGHGVGLVLGVALVVGCEDRGGGGECPQETADEHGCQGPHPRPVPGRGR